MPESGDEQRRSLRNQKDRDRRKARGLKVRGNGGPNKNQGRKPSPDRPSCPLGNVDGCRLASHGKRGWHCRADRGGCGKTVKPIDENAMIEPKPANISFRPDPERNRILVDAHSDDCRDTIAIIYRRNGALEVELLAPLPGAEATILAWWKAEDLGSKAIA